MKTLREPTRELPVVAEPDVLVSGNIGCLQHLASGKGLSQPVLHIAELLDWAEGGGAAPWA